MFIRCSVRANSEPSRRFFPRSRPVFDWPYCVLWLDVRRRERGFGPQKMAFVSFGQIWSVYGTKQNISVFGLCVLGEACNAIVSKAVLKQSEWQFYGRCNKGKRLADFPLFFALFNISIIPRLGLSLLPRERNRCKWAFVFHTHTPVLLSHLVRTPLNEARKNKISQTFAKADALSEKYATKKISLKSISASESGKSKISARGESKKKRNEKENSSHS